MLLCDRRGNHGKKLLKKSTKVEFRSFLPSFQGYKDVLSNLLGGLVSLSPLTTSIEEFASSAKEAEIEAQVN